MNFRRRLLSATDRATAVAIVLLTAGTAAAFGGRVWWAPLGIAVLGAGLVLFGLARMLLEGAVPVLKSPLAVLGVLALGLAATQIAPLPPDLSERLSPGAHQAYALGFLPDRARQLDPSLEMPDSPTIRSPASLDRSATARWLGGAAACLALFWTVSRYADRLGRFYLVAGSVVAAFFLNTAVAAVQFACKARGLYGVIEPGRGPVWAPSGTDLLAGPNVSVLRASASRAGPSAWALAVPDRPFFVGGQMGGPGAYLALGAVALPLALALTLQLLAPRGSRESMGVRLKQSGQGSLVGLVYFMLLLSAVLVGLLAGPWFSLPFAIGLAVVGIPSAWPSGLKWSSMGLTLLAIVALGGGAAAGELLATSKTSPVPARLEVPGDSGRVWSDALTIARDFPLVGTGLGTFASVYPSYKTQDAAPSTAMSSLLQWWVESGYVGLGLLGLAGLWCLARAPGAVRRVGSADRALAFGLIGTALTFTLFSAVHWTVELASVALAASALAGAGDRWLAGGTDLFVERG